MKKWNIMVIGAHPDDCEGGCGGTALKYRQAGCRVTFVSMTDGSAGHQTMKRGELAAVRAVEAETSAALVGADSVVLHHPDGALEASIPVREELLRLIRRISPDLIITHRLNDYHPDHRRTAELVQDSSYLVMVPAVCPDTPAMNFQPAIFFMYDTFRRPYPFAPDIAVRTDDVVSTKIQMFSCHKSQYLDFLPWMAHIQKSIPDDYKTADYPRDQVLALDGDAANACRAVLEKRYGAAAGQAIPYAEGFELSEYGSQLSTTEMEDRFPL